MTWPSWACWPTAATNSPRARTQAINRLHRLLAELLPGGAKKFLSAAQARALIATIKPRDLVGKTRRWLVVELIGQLDSIDNKIKAADKELQQLVIDCGFTLMGLHGIGASSAARLLADVGNIHRFRDRDRFASCKRHSTLGRLLRRTIAPPPVPSRESQNQPCPAHHGRRATPQSHRRPHILRRQESSREDLDGGHARTQTTTI